MGIRLRFISAYLKPWEKMELENRAAVEALRHFSRRLKDTENWVRREKKNARDSGKENAGFG